MVLDTIKNLLGNSKEQIQSEKKEQKEERQEEPNPQPKILHYPRKPGESADFDKGVILFGDGGRAVVYKAEETETEWKFYLDPTKKLMRDFELQRELVKNRGEQGSALIIRTYPKEKIIVLRKDINIENIYFCMLNVNKEETPTSKIFSDNVKEKEKVLEKNKDLKTDNKLKDNAIDGLTSVKSQLQNTIQNLSSSNNSLHEKIENYKFENTELKEKIKSLEEEAFDLKSNLKKFEKYEKRMKMEKKKQRPPHAKMFEAHKRYDGGAGESQVSIAKDMKKDIGTIGNWVKKVNIYLEQEENRKKEIEENENIGNFGGINE